MDGDGGYLGVYRIGARGMWFRKLEVWYSLSGVKCKEGIESVEEWCDFLKSWVEIRCSE